MSNILSNMLCVYHVYSLIWSHDKSITDIQSIETLLCKQAISFKVRHLDVMCGWGQLHSCIHHTHTRKYDDPGRHVKFKWHIWNAVYGRSVSRWKAAASLATHMHPEQQEMLAFLFSITLQPPAPVQVVQQSEQSSFWCDTHHTQGQSVKA